MEGDITVQTGPPAVEKRRQEPFTQIGIQRVVLASEVIVGLVQVLELRGRRHRPQLLEATTAAGGDTVKPIDTESGVEQAGNTVMNVATTKQTCTLGRFT